MASPSRGNGGRVAGPRSVVGKTFLAGRDARVARPRVSGHDLSIRQIGPSMRTGMFQLPPDIDDFIGRDDDLRTIQDLLEPSNDQARAVVVSAVAGRAGVGKTALATRAAHRLRPSFPDGQLYVNLRGVEAQHLKPADVLSEFLRELGMARGAIPDRLDQRAARYRAQLADRRVLVVLDNARDEAQVRPLLPGSGGAALITSRARLSGLEAAHSVVLDVLERDQAVELLAKVVGWNRVAAEPEAARAIVELCGYLPLAVRISAAKLVTSGHAPLTILASQLAGEHGRLAELRTADLEVRASFALNYQDLHEDERRIFRLLGLLEAPQFSAWVAAALLDGELAEAEELIERLARAHVLELAQQTPTGGARYRFHDLLRVFAKERLRAEEPVTAQKSALHRALETYLTLASRAAELLEPSAGKAPAVTRPMARLSSVMDLIADNPGAWFTDERVNLIAVVEQASKNDLREVIWKLARSLAYFFELRTHWTDWEHTQRLALRAARRAENRHEEATALRSLGHAYTQMGRLNKAIAHFEPALILFRALSDRRGEAWTLEGLGLVHRNQGRFDEGLACFEQGLTLFRQVGDRRGEAYCLVNLGIVHRDKGQFQTALEWFDQARPIFRELADHHGETYVLLNEGHMLREQGRFEEALGCLDDCLAAFRQISERAGEAWTRINLGMVRQAQGGFDAAITEFDRCQALFASLDDRRGSAWTSMGFGHVYLAQGGEDALAYFEGAVRALREIGDQLGLAKALCGAGLTLAAHGDRKSATVRWQEALAIFRKLGASESSKVEAWLTE